MVCRQFGTKPLSEPKLTYLLSIRLSRKNCSIPDLWIKIYKIKCFRKYPLQNVRNLFRPKYVQLGIRLVRLFCLGSEKYQYVLEVSARTGSISTYWKYQHVEIKCNYSWSFTTPVIEVMYAISCYVELTGIRLFVRLTATDTFPCSALLVL